MFSLFCNCREVNNPSIGGENIYFAFNFYHNLIYLCEASLNTYLHLSMSSLNTLITAQPVNLDAVDAVVRKHHDSPSHSAHNTTQWPVWTIVGFRSLGNDAPYTLRIKSMLFLPFFLLISGYMPLY